MLRVAHRHKLNGAAVPLLLFLPVVFPEFLMFQRGRLELIREPTMKQKLITIVLSGAIAFPLAAYAETPSLGEIVVTASRMPQPLAQTIAHTTVLNEQEIRKSGAPDVPTLLRSLAGLEVAQSGGLGKLSGTFMRGTNSSHVLVLLDGVRINSATSGSTALEHIMLDSVARIEVVRGNASSLYGSEAIGGVIQLFTKRGHGAPAVNASAGLGNQNTQRLAAGFSGEVNDTSFSVNAGKTKTDGVSAVNPQLAARANPDRDGYDNTTFSAQLQHAFNADHQLSASLFDSSGNSQTDNSFFPAVPADAHRSKSNIRKLALAVDDRISDAWQSKLQLAQGTDDSQSFLNGVPDVASGALFKTTNRQLVWQNEVLITDNQRINLAAEHLAQAVTSSTAFSRTRRNVGSLLGGYVGKFGMHQVQFNLRHDNYSDFGIANTGLFGYGLQFADAWRLTASIGNAFKAPTFNDLFYPLTWGFAGNPNLRPERARNREAGLRYAANGQRLDVVYFDNRIRDLIATNNTFTTMENIGEARIDGFELDYAGKFGSTHLTANATLQNPRDTATGKVLPRRAREHANFGIAHEFGAWDAGAELHHSGARKNSNFDNFVLPGYQLVNLAAAYKIDAHLNLSARVDNLFDRAYTEAYSFNTLGRRLFVGLSYRQ